MKCYYFIVYELLKPSITTVPKMATSANIYTDYKYPPKHLQQWLRGYDIYRLVKQRGCKLVVNNYNHFSAVRLPLMTPDANLQPLQPKYIYLGQPVPSSVDGSVPSEWSSQAMAFYIEDIYIFTDGESDMHDFTKDRKFDQMVLLYFLCILMRKCPVLYL